MTGCTRALLAAIAAALIAGSAHAADPTKVTLVLSRPNVAPAEDVFLFAVPKALGYFKDENLDVTILNASGGAQAAQVMQSGTAQFATVMAEGVLALREQGGQPKAFYELKRNNGFSVGVLPDSPLKTLADLQGKKIGFPVAGGGTKMIVDESFRAVGLEPNYVSVVIGAGAPAAAAIRNKQVDAAVLWDAAFAYVENQGIKLNYIDLGIQEKLAGMSLVTTDSFMAANPQVVASFCRAVAKGLHFALTNKDAAINIFFKEFPTALPADLDADTARKQARHVLEKWLEQAQRGLPYGEKTGEIRPDRWSNASKLYSQFGMLKADKPDGAYVTNYFDQCNAFDRDAVAAAAKAAK